MSKTAASPSLLVLALTLALVVVTGMVVTPRASAETAEHYGAQRQQFLDALAELRTGTGPRYKALRGQLNAYPLALYLDYEVLTSQLHDLDPATAEAFMVRAEGSPLRNRFLAAYLQHKGHDRQWRDFLAVIDAPPRDTELQCYYYRALRDTGDKAAAWQGAASLWNVGKSQDKACDPLFERWMQNGGGPDDGLVWSRALKAFDARSLHIIKYIRRYASAELKPLLDELIEVYRRPDRLVRDAHKPGIQHAQLMTVGIRRLARVNPGNARKALLNAESVQPFTDMQRDAMELMIARHSLFAQSAAPEPWLMETLERVRDDELTEVFLRKQVEESHWPDLLHGLEWLSPAARNKDQWRYWAARALAATGDSVGAAQAYTALAGERSYHGFLAAEKAGLPYALNHIESLPVKPIVDAGLDRVNELLAIDRVEDARAEWITLIYQHNREGQLSLAQTALQRGWQHFAIHAANTAKAWDRVDLRFPPAFEKIFAKAAAAHNLETAELMAIARRESALYPQAQSRVGARGLMQVMPATGRLVARQAGMKWRQAGLYEPEYNVAIGSRYYHSLLKRFDGHRPMALAGYNAGPNRVERWRESDLPTDQWIDSLPFRETREYVQAILAYTVIYREQAGQPSKVLSADEWTLSNQELNL